MPEAIISQWVDFSFLIKGTLLQVQKSDKLTSRGSAEVDCSQSLC